MTSLAAPRTPDTGEPYPSYRPVFFVAMTLIACLAGTLSGWGMYARLDSAVVAHGVLLAESQRKTIEHLEGGILRTLHVKAGDRVAEGQILATLDATQSEAQLSQLRGEELALTYEIWRLDAEYADAPTLDPRTAPSKPSEGRQLQIDAQLRLFDARRRAYLGQIELLRRQIDQLSNQVDANTARAVSADRQLASWQDERARTATLVDKGAAAGQRLLELDRNVALSQGDRDEHRGLAGSARESIARTGADIETLQQQRLADIGERLVESRRRLAEITSQIRGALDVLERRQLRAPQAGLVVNISTVTPGAVIGSGVPLMEIVPDGDPLVVEARLPPDTIDTVHVGRSARVRLTAYKRSKAPTIDGEVIYVSADLLTDERDGTSYFEARISIDASELDGLDDVTLTAGMPVEVAIKTGERRAGDYFLEPLLRHLHRALREE